MYRTVYKNNGKISPIQEVDANRFSAELLIPEALAKFIVSKFPEIIIKNEDDGSFDYDNDFLEFLSNRFEVSRAVIGFRLRKFIKH
jgi:Zn-dependent peptidase ImmA (M78 family)